MTTGRVWRAVRRWPRRFTARHHLNIAAEYDRMADDAEAGGARYTARLLRELAAERRKQAGYRPGGR